MLHEEDFITPLITYVGEVERMATHVLTNPEAHNRRIRDLANTYRDMDDPQTANSILREVVTPASLTRMIEQVRICKGLIKNQVWSALFPSIPPVPPEVLMHIYAAGVPLGVGLPNPRTEEDIWVGIIAMNPGLYGVMRDLVHREPALRRAHDIFRSACMHDSNYFPPPLSVYDLEELPDP